MPSTLNSTLLKTARDRWSSLLKTFKYSSIKQAIFEQAQEASNLKPLKVLKTCTTRWLTHGESCIRVLPRLHPLIDALDVIFFERGDAESKGVRDQLLEPNLLLMLLLLAEVLGLINILAKYLQTNTRVRLDHCCIFPSYKWSKKPSWT